MSHNHVLYDSDPHFKIDPISRKITNESSTKTTVVQHDHNSERFTFESPRHVEGHDLSLCNIVEIHYLNVEANTKIVRAGVYTVDDLHVKDDDDETVVCSWVVPSNATQFVGQLQFLVRFSCVNDETGKLEYAWNTIPYSSITVSQGIYNTDTPSDNFVFPYNFVTTIDGQMLKFFVGTKKEYEALTHDEKQGLFALITDDSTKKDLEDSVKRTEAMVDQLKSDLEGGEFNSAYDGEGNVIHETYGNFAKTWLTSTSVSGKETISLYGAGTYQFCVEVPILEYVDILQDYISRKINVCALVYFDGSSPTYSALIETSTDESNNIHSYRLAIDGTGKVTVEERLLSTHTFMDYVTVSDVKIRMRKIL